MTCLVGHTDCYYVMSNSLCGLPPERETADIIQKITFFFYWHYNPLWILAFSVILFHSALSSHCFLHRLIPIIYVFSSMSTIHLFLGLPLILVPIGFHSNNLLGVLLSSIRITWPSQAILLLFVNITMSAFSIILFSPQNYLIQWNRDLENLAHYEFEITVSVT